MSSPALGVADNMNDPQDRAKEDGMRTVQLSETDTLLLTRGRGRTVGKNLPQAAELCLDFSKVQAASPSFLDELIKVASSRDISLSAVNVSKRIRTTLETLSRVNGDRRVAISA